MIQQELLDFVRGTGLQISVAVFMFGLVYRVLHIILLGRRPNFAVPRGSEWSEGLRTVWHRSFSSVRLSPRGYFIIAAGYVFHIGFLVTFLFFSQHIEMLHEAVGLHWPALPPGLITISAILAIAAMIALLLHRLIDPVKRMISDFQDYLTWALTILPLLTGLMVGQSIGLDYQIKLIMHIASVELLLILVPFTKLAHMVTAFSARWYNGAAAGYKGVSV
jgi:nitrate reductase gamma subunit